QHLGLGRPFTAHTGTPPPPGPMHLFRIDVMELAFLQPASDHLRVESWAPHKGLRLVERR
ncbi:MAG: hypothetical protein M3Q68_06780, partial [Actinomycetota bacterium]|nr:hypothetical protein [Actinomycetota bacterium]